MSRLPLRSLSKVIFFPSGDQAGRLSFLVLFVRFFAPDPGVFGLMVSISLLPVRFVSKAMRDPSGAQLGSVSVFTFLVIWTRAVPPALMVQTSRLPFRS